MLKSAINQLLIAKDIIVNGKKIAVDIIPIDRAEVKILSEDIYSRLEDKVRLIKSGNIDSIFIEHSYELLNLVDNNKYNIRVSVESDDLSKMNVLVIGAAHTYIPGEDKYIDLIIDSNLTVEEFFNKRNHIIKQMYEILLHEITHMFDKDLKQEDVVNPDDDYAKYVNSNPELKAYIQQIVSQTRENLYRLRKEKPKSNMLIDKAIEASDVFKQLKLYLSTKNLIDIKRSVIKHIENTEM